MTILFRNQSPITLHFNAEMCTQLKILGVIYDCDLTWAAHIDAVVRKARQKIFLLSKLRNDISKKDLIKIYSAFILTSLEYCSALFVGLNNQLSERLEKIRRKCHRIVCGSECSCGCFTPLFNSSVHKKVPPRTKSI